MGMGDEKRPIMRPIAGGGVVVDFDEVERQVDEHLSEQAMPAWTTLCRLLEERGILITGEVPPEAVVKMHEVVHALVRCGRRRRED